MASEPAGTSGGKGPMPPHTQLFDFLSEAERADLLAWAIDNEKSFKPAKVYYHGGEHGTYVDVDKRKVLKLRDLGPSEHVLSKRLMGCLPAIMEGTAIAARPQDHWSSSSTPTAMAVSSVGTSTSQPDVTECR